VVARAGAGKAAFVVRPQPQRRVSARCSVTSNARRGRSKHLSALDADHLGVGEITAATGAALRGVEDHRVRIIDLRQRGTQVVGLLARAALRALRQLLRLLTRGPASLRPGLTLLVLGLALGDRVGRGRLPRVPARLPAQPFHLDLQRRQSGLQRGAVCFQLEHRPAQASFPAWRRSNSPAIPQF
jgi:hypothetical protein